MFVTKWKTGVVNAKVGQEGPEGLWRYSSTLSLTSVLDGGGWPESRPGRFTLVKEIQYSFYRTQDGPQGKCWQVQKTSPPPGFAPRSVSPLRVPIPTKLSRPRDRCGSNQWTKWILPWKTGYCVWFDHLFTYARRTYMKRFSENISFH